MRHLEIPDTQIKYGEDLTFLTWIGKYIVQKKPDVIIHLGDFADMFISLRYLKEKYD